jgi:hypothetical protein
MEEGVFVNSVTNILVPKYEWISCLTQQVLAPKEGSYIWD